MIYFLSYTFSPLTKVFKTRIFGMAAYTISKRLRELGIRLALGAQRREILQSALGRAFKLVAIGSGAGTDSVTVTGGGTGFTTGGGASATDDSKTGAGASAAMRNSIINRLGLLSCEGETSTAAATSSTTRVTPGLVSATRIRCTSLSTTSLFQIRRPSTAGTAPLISK